jgi:hypothetical protein
MYPFVLAILVGFFSVQISNLLIDNVSYLEKIPFLNRSNHLFITVTILLVILTDTSLLGAYGMGNQLQWVDVIGTSFSIVGIVNVIDTISARISR